MKKKHRTKFCGKCLKTNPVGSKVCTHCGWTFKRGKLGQIIDRFKKILVVIGEKKIG